LRLLVSLAADHDGPGHAGNLVGQGDRSNHCWPALHQPGEPRPPLSAPALPPITDVGRHIQASIFGCAFMSTRPNRHGRVTICGGHSNGSSPRLFALCELAPKLAPNAEVPAGIDSDDRANPFLETCGDRRYLCVW